MSHGFKRCACGGWGVVLSVLQQTLMVVNSRVYVCGFPDASWDTAVRRTGGVGGVRGMLAGSTSGFVHMMRSPWIDASRL